MGPRSGHLRLVGRLLLILLCLAGAGAPRRIRAEGKSDEPIKSTFAERFVNYESYYLEDEPTRYGEDEPAEELPGGEPSLAERLAQLEANYQSLSRQNEDLGAQYDDLQSSLSQYVRPGHDESTMQVSGRVHLDHWAFPGDSPGTNAFETGDADDPPQDRFLFRRLRFGVAGDVWENMVYKIELELADPDDAEFRDAYLGWTDLPFLQKVLVGNQKRPYGLDHLNSSRYNVFMERPFIIEGFNQDARRLGVLSYGYSEDLSYNWRYGVFNLQNIQDDGQYVSNHYQLQFAGRLANTLWYDECSDGRGYAHWAVSGTIAHPDGVAESPDPDLAENQAHFDTRPEARTSSRWLDTGSIVGADSYELLGLESVLNIGPLQWVGEYQNVWLQRTPGDELHLHGGYMYLSYFLTGEHMPWNRELGILGRPIPHENFFLVERCRGGLGAGWGAWQLAVRWSYADLSDQDILGGVGESLTFGLNWYWNPYARMQFNYLYGDIHNHAPVDGQTFGHYQILGTRFMVDF